MSRTKEQKPDVEKGGASSELSQRQVFETFTNRTNNIALLHETSITVKRSVNRFDFLFIAEYHKQINKRKHIHFMCSRAWTIYYSVAQSHSNSYIHQYILSR